MDSAWSSEHNQSSTYKFEMKFWGKLVKRMKNRFVEGSFSIWWIDFKLFELEEKSKSFYYSGSCKQRTCKPVLRAEFVTKWGVQSFGVRHC